MSAIEFASSSGVNDDAASMAALRLVADEKPGAADAADDDDDDDKLRCEKRLYMMHKQMNAPTDAASASTTCGTDERSSEFRSNRSNNDADDFDAS